MGTQVQSKKKTEEMVKIGKRRNKANKEPDKIKTSGVEYG
jgi:hypothetical protein